MDMLSAFSDDFSGLVSLKNTIQDEGKLCDRFASQTSLDEIEQKCLNNVGQPNRRKWFGDDLDCPENETDAALNLRLKDELIGIDRTYRSFERCVQRLPGFRDSRNRVDPKAPLVYGSTPPEQSVYLYGDPIGIGIKIPHLEKFQDTAAYTDVTSTAQTAAAAHINTSAGTSAAITAPKAIQARPLTNSSAQLQGPTDAASKTNSGSVRARNPPTSSSSTSNEQFTNDGVRRKTSSSGNAVGSAQQQRGPSSGNNADYSAASGGRTSSSSKTSSAQQQQQQHPTRQQQQNRNEYYEQQTGGDSRYFYNTKYQQQSNAPSGGKRGSDGGHSPTPPGRRTTNAASNENNNNNNVPSKNWRAQASPHAAAAAATDAGGSSRRNNVSNQS